MQPHLNWRELENLVSELTHGISGLFVDRVVIPQRPEFKDGFIKQEWAIRLTNSKQEFLFLFSVRPQHPYFIFTKGKGPKAAEHATRSGFDLLLHKELSGQRVTGVHLFKNERSFAILFDGLALVLQMIPAHPEALLLQCSAKDLQSQKPLKILGRTRKQPLEPGYIAPVVPEIKNEAKVRDELASSLSAYKQKIEESLLEESFSLRQKTANQEIKQQLKRLQSRLTQTQKAEQDAINEPDYKYWGDLLKGLLGLDVKPQKGVWKVQDWETSKKIEIPADPKLTLSETVKKMYSLASRKKRRIEEAGIRVDSFENKISKLLKLQKMLEEKDFKTIADVEQQLGLSAAPVAEKSKTKKARFGWAGYTFFSKEGLPICVGRSRDENLELTFKFANGNDLWLHVRGRPSAHVVIALRSKNSASLETILDAAYLLMHYSKLTNKTEVDYTFKKYVKRIKDSTEASYTNNKTIFVEPNPKRLQELLAQQT